MNKTKTIIKLPLRKETIRALLDADLAIVGGGEATTVSHESDLLNTSGDKNPNIAPITGCA